MRVVVVGAGPVGLFCAIALARRGHTVAVVDRDAGPPASGRWRRRGVMQFDHAHTFRAPVVDALRAEMPDVVDALTVAGAGFATDRTGEMAALLCRRSTLERVLHRIALRQNGITRHVATVDRPHRANGRVAGVVTVHGVLAADLVVDASGRSARYLRDLRPDAVGGDCGAVYATRQYRLHPGAAAGPVNSPIGLSLSMSGYAAIAFLHDSGTFSVTITHDGGDLRLRRLREDSVFETAVGAIPQLADWIDPRRSRPLASVFSGGRLYNSYRSQVGPDGAPYLPGLISVGDAVCTTTPLAGRGVTLGLMQSRALLAILDTEPDIGFATGLFDDWCERNVRPWFDDHRRVDGDRVRRWAGGAVDLTRPLPSDLIVAAADADPGLRPLVEPYATMAALPASLAAAEPRAREIFAGGWRPAAPPGPTRAGLADLCGDRPAAAVTGAVSRSPAAV
ncbi:FAD-dependent oxidoreductase [Mycobacterium sp. IS-1496]|uniref:FAD-dependent oxidoreductase n=1 Tax=Mycobacterium sp. IS-1496 TaxID=1772284 RepID=UPI000741693C|nr:FAD-dependent oxidoreductase [Mycobacterium sp. IS-1496]KUI37021.1 FAD-dependent oxidoreductase [Mycobacterium sp. IS-1496]